MEAILWISEHQAIVLISLYHQKIHHDLSKWNLVM